MFPLSRWWSTRFAASNPAFDPYRWIIALAASQISWSDKITTAVRNGLDAISDDLPMSAKIIHLGQPRPKAGMRGRTDHVGVTRGGKLRPAQTVGPEVDK